MNCNFMEEAGIKINKIKPKHYRVNRKRYEKQEKRKRKKDFSFSFPLHSRQQMTINMLVRGRP